jgi:tight adherence protein C
LSVLYAAILMLGAGAVLILAYGVLCMPVVPPSLLGIRGLKRVQALRHSRLFFDLEPALRGSGMQVRKMLGGRVYAALDRQLMLAGDFFGLLPEEFVALSALLAGLGLSLGWAYSFLGERSLAYALVAALLGGLAPYSRLTAMQEERQKRVDTGLPPVIDLLVLGLSAGLDLPGALRQVVDKSSDGSDVLIEELGFVLRELHVGKTRKAALLQLCERLPTQSVREFTGAVIQAEEHGHPLSRVLQIHAEVSRRERSTRAEEAAAKAGVKMMVPMVMLFVALLLLIVGPMFLSAQARL